MGTEQILVPMPMKAMLVGAPQDYFADTAYNYASLKEAPLGNNVEPNPRGMHSNEDKGIHLHWILPEIMKQGRQDDQKEDVIYPIVPNRWQITRLWAGSNTKEDSVQSLSWFVESDVLQKEYSYENGNLKSPQFPTLTDFNQQFRFLGRSYLASKKPFPSPCKEALEQLTATAPGLPAFAAYYPDCRNVFGFYDEMKDQDGKEIEKVCVTYVVCGFYENSSQDILSGIQSGDESIEKLGWRVPENTIFPAKTICHSVLGGIQWETKKTKYESNIPKNNPDIAVGNTTAEALAALAERKNPSNHVLERMMNLFYSGGEMLLKEKNGLLKSETKLHEDRFGKETPLVQLALKEKSEQKSMDIKEIPPSDKVSEINRGYIELFNKNAEFKKLQETVHDYWYKYIYLGEETYFTPEERQLAEKCQKDYIEKFDLLEKTIVSMRIEIENLKNKLEQEAERVSHNLINYSLIPLNGQAFWAPKEPVLLLSGIQRDNLGSEYIRQSEEGALFCRNGAQLISTLTIDKLDGAFNIPTTVSAGDISLTGEIPEAIEPFVWEALIVHSDFSGKLASIILTKRGCKTDTNMKALTEIIKTLQNCLRSKKLTISLGRNQLSAASGFNGVFPDRIAVAQYSKPWAPLLLRWAINYYADKAILEDEPSIRNWELKETLADYHFSGQITTAKPVVIQGKSILAPNGSEITAGYVSRILGNQALAEEALGMDVLSQAFGGINSALIMEKAEIMLPVKYVNPDGMDLGNTKLPVGKIVSLLTGYGGEDSFYDEFFSPVRGGFFNIDKISIIDSFGQLKEIKKPNAAVTENMRNNASVEQKNIMLTPRLIQPSRLNFRWLNPTTSIPEDENSTVSPICGWLLPNHTEGSIMVYDHSGDLLGSLQRVKLKEPVVWKDIPERGGGTVPLPENMNPTLYKLLSPILKYSYEEGTDLLKWILEVIDSSLWNINPEASQQYNSLGQYIGRPLIVTNSCIMLEQRDVPKVFKHMETRDDTGGYNSKIDVKKAKFQVQVGKANNHGDGVIGYFQDGNFDVMHITAEKAPIKHSYFDTLNKVTVSLGDVKPTKLTVLMDFAASMDFIGGFLPTKTVRPDSQAISEALDKIFFTIFSAPVLGDREAFAVPYPKLDGRKWEWLHPTSIGFMEDVICNASEQAYFPETGVCAEEGWLKLMLNEVHKNNN